MSTKDRTVEQKRAAEIAKALGKADEYRDKLLKELGHAESLISLDELKVAELAPVANYRNMIREATRHQSTRLWLLWTDIAAARDK